MPQGTITTLHQQPQPSRVPPPGDAAVTSFYEAQVTDPKWEAENPQEMAVLGHIRGWAHFGPMCALCKAESHA